ncbi:MAG TPA: 5'/3'-nucleotidase SurE [Puia sp.]
MAKKNNNTTPPSEAPPAGIIRQTDPVSRTGRSGKTGATGIIRATHKNGMAGMDGKATKPLPAAKATKSAGNGGTGGRKKLPVILITNDDGISAPGIRNLVEAVKGLGKVVVVAPDKPQSGMGHAITIGNPLRLHPMHHLFEGVDAWQCSGTPVDCVKLAVDKVLRRKPDLCLSGINHGANHSINVIYSGTMSAAVEAAIESIPSVGFSLLDYSVEADFSAARKYVRIIVEQILQHPLDKHLILNVNFPSVPDSLIKGVKICRQAYAKYEEDFIERNDPTGKKYYWLTGKFVNFDKGRDTDVWALEHNYVSVVPVQFDMTNYVLKSKLEKTWKS